MRVGIIQSNYIPWRGYFDFIDDVDLFIFHDDLQFTKGDWRNRNRIKTRQGTTWLTVPVNYDRVDQLIERTPIDGSQPWPRKHLAKLDANYAGSSHYGVYIDGFREIVERNWPSLSELNVALCQWVMECLGIRTPTRMSRELGASGRKTEKVVDLLTKAGADTYLTGPSAKAYLDLDRFERHGIRVEYKTYDYPEYPQLWGEFVGAVSVLDLLFNTGPEAREYLKSRAPNKLVLR